MRSVRSNSLKVREYILGILFICCLVSPSLENFEGDVLHDWKQALWDPVGVLQSWDPTLVNPCTWFHVTCDNENFVTRVDLGNAGLSGSLVPTLGHLTHLKYLELYSNNISGVIPPELGNLTNLVSLDLYHNSFASSIPDSLGSLAKLRVLRLNNNFLTGNIPTSLTNIGGLQVLDLSNNNLIGKVPVNGSFSLFTPKSFENNSAVCGEANHKICPLIPAPVRQGNTPSLGAIAGGVAAGAALLFAMPTIGFAWWRRRRSQESSNTEFGQLRRFSLRELQVATDDFSNRNVLGRDAFGKVYRGRLSDGSLVAVKRLKEEQSAYGEFMFQMEVKIISMAVHRNLLRLRGFCMTPTEWLLVYPYMANGDLDSRIRGGPPLDWATRKRIALGAARGLSYLHDHCNPRIIHRDVKPSNVLLDEEYEAVVGDFGLAKLLMEDTPVTTAVCGTVGYMSPEYLSTGKVTEKADVFAYGIMLLELLTGQRPFDLSRNDDDDDGVLLNRVKRLLREKKNIVQLVDCDTYNVTDAEELIQVALLCTRPLPRDRPKMADVVRMLEGDGLTERWEEWQVVEMVRNQEVEFLPHRASDWHGVVPNQEVEFIAPEPISPIGSDFEGSLPRDAH